MASTRDKRMKTDSPTPVQPTETTTPSTKTSTAIKLKRMPRNRSGLLSVKTENEDGNDSVGLSEDTQSSAASIDNSSVAPKTPNTRTKRQTAKDEKDDESNGDLKDDDVESQKSDAGDTADSPSTRGKRRGPTKAQLLKMKGKALALARRQALMKRKSLPLPVKSSVRTVSRRLSAGVKLAEEKEKEELPVNVRKGKQGRKPADKKEIDGNDNETVEADQDAKSEASETEPVTEAPIKQEKHTAIAAVDLQGIRRSTRQRKSTIKDRDSPFSRRSNREKSESKRDSISPALSAASIKTEKDTSKEIILTVEAPEITEKDQSMSPELVSEELDTESVQHLYDKPDFLENNLGIEQDPKLGEIVKEQEKTKVLESGEKDTLKDDSIKMETEEIQAADSEPMEQEKASQKELIEPDEKMNIDGNATKDDDANDKESDETESNQKDEKSEMPAKEPEIEIKKEPEMENIPDKSEIKTEKIETPADEVETGEENKENNVESSAKPIENGSPRSEDRLKTVTEANVPSVDLNESAELFKQKETHLMSLGLLTHKAADEAKLAKLQRKEELAKITAANQHTSSGRKSKKDSSNEQQYTGTLKTVIKLNRGEKDKRRTRMPLKMTFQKKNRTDRDSNGSAHSSESFYTIQNERDSTSSESHGAISRKSHNRSHNHDQVAPSNEQTKTNEPVVNKELDQSLVIPEKASSFKVHPERICKDQCFYCGGKFGLYDTPCHIAQIKSVERQNKILQSEEKLTKDSCLCDACFRHVDRRANCPSYKSKRLSAPPQLQSNSNASQQQQQQQQQQNNFDRTYGVCNVVDCGENAIHNIRKKWFMKMKKSISKIFNVNMDIQPTNANVSICEEHFAALSHMMICAMCKRKLPRNHIFYINQDVTRLEHLISEQGMHIKLSNSTLVVCKLCSYYNNLLFKPPEPKTQKADFVKNYTKKLLKHNNMDLADYEKRQVVAVDDDDVQEVPVRADNLTLTIKNGRIQPKKLPHQDRFQNNKEVTITSMKGSPAGSGHMLLDNDVMVGYDVPMLDCPSPPAHAIRNPNYKGPAQAEAKNHHHHQDQMRKRKEINDNNEMARVLKSNPNISMRELFPGEEEMGLQINLPFNSNSAQRTPEGWVKVNMTVQYDDVTKALWEHLQRPYGNQSSFLRHLILLEKYYRNGDLVLSQSASNSATTYSESVRNRLRAYDNIPSASPAPPTSFSNEITITPATKAKSKSNDGVTITQQHGGSLLKRKVSQSDTSPKQKLQKIEDGTPKKTMPPELISFAPKPVAKNKDSGKESSTSPPTFINQSISITPTTTPSQNQQHSSNNGNVIVLPETLTPQERKQCNKSWRPTLIPITSGSSAMLNAGGPLYQTADGRKLPALVQVMSGGKPYHISINDYNRMCIIRREKLQQTMIKNRQQSQTGGGGSPNGQHTSNTTTTTSNNSLSIIPMVKDKEGFKNPAPASGSTTSPSNVRNKMNIPNQILEQNSLIPLNSNVEQNGKRHHNGTGLPPPLTPTFSTGKGIHNMGIPMPPSALSALSKTVNALQPPASAAAQMAIWNQIFKNEMNINSDNMAALAQIANLASLGPNMMDTSILKIPKSLTVIPQAKEK